MNKIDIILIYLIIIISFVCIIKIYLNNKNIERFYSFNREFSGVMRFIDNDNLTRYLGSYPHDWDDCFNSSVKECRIDETVYEYDSDSKKIKKKNSKDQDEMIDVTDIRLPKGDKGDDGIDAIQPPINFYYINNDGHKINEDEDGEITTVTPVDHRPFYEVEGQGDEIDVYVKRHDNCTPETCNECTGNVSIDSISATDDGTAVTVNGNITTNNIILQEGGKICIDNVSDAKCLTYDNISKLIEWSNYIDSQGQDT